MAPLTRTAQQLQEAKEDTKVQSSSEAGQNLNLPGLQAGLLPTAQERKAEGYLRSPSLSLAAPGVLACLTRCSSPHETRHQRPPPLQMRIEQWLQEWAGWNLNPGQPGSHTWH